MKLNKFEFLNRTTAVVVTSPDVQSSKVITGKKKDEGQIYLFADKKTQPNITYYVGYGWERAGDIKTVQSWQRYLNNFKERVDNPVSVKFAD